MAVKSYSNILRSIKAQSDRHAKREKARQEQVAKFPERVTALCEKLQNDLDPIDLSQVKSETIGELVANLFMKAGFISDLGNVYFDQKPQGKHILHEVNFGGTGTPGARSYSIQVVRVLEHQPNTFAVDVYLNSLLT